MASTQSYLRYGSNSIRGYTGDELQFEIAPQGITALRAETTHTITFTGPWAADKSVSAEMYRLGGIVTLVVPTITAATSNAASAITATAGTVLPAGYRPTTEIHNQCIAVDGVDHVQAEIVIGTDGTIRISPFVVATAACTSEASGTAKTFNNGGAVGVYSWMVQFKAGGAVTIW